MSGPAKGPPKTNVLFLAGLPPVPFMAAAKPWSACCEKPKYGRHALEKREASSLGKLLPFHVFERNASRRAALVGSELINHRERAENLFLGPVPDAKRLRGDLFSVHRLCEGPQIGANGVRQRYPGGVGQQHREPEHVQLMLPDVVRFDVSAPLLPLRKIEERLRLERKGFASNAVPNG